MTWITVRKHTRPEAQDRYGSIIQGQNPIAETPLSLIETLRAQLFKIGGRIRQTARCVRVHLASGWPFKNLFRSAAFAVNSS